MSSPTGKANSFVNLTPGDPAPWFHQRSTSNPRYAFDTVGGRWVVLCFFGTAGDEDGKRALAAIAVNRALFDDERACFFGISLDPNDEATQRVAEAMPGLRYFWDFDGIIARAYGAIAQDATPGAVAAEHGLEALRRAHVSQSGRRGRLRVLACQGAR